MEAERIRVMVTVKAYPTLSRQYNETVCVAGVRMDTERPKHVRLFTAPFRDMEQAKQFFRFLAIGGSSPPRRLPTPRRPVVFSPA